MPEFMAHHTHRPEQCQEMYDAWNESDAPQQIRGKPIFCTCPTGEHGSFSQVEAASPDEVLSLLPAKLRPTTRVYGGETLRDW
jgi:hypothetical protein